MSNSWKIIKIKKNEDGEITDVMLEEGSVVPMNQAILMAKDGHIEGTVVTRGKNGGEFLMIEPISLNVKHISDLPTFKD